MGRIDLDTFICIDCETTGLDAEQDAIIEIAGVRFRGNEVLETFEMLIDPERIIPESSVAIHHITQEMVQGKPKIAEVLPTIIKFIGRDIIVGHSISFDVAVVRNAAKRHNIPTIIGNNILIDTLRMARLYGGSAINSLAQLQKHFNIPYDGSHRAMADVVVNVELFKHLASNYKTTEILLKTLEKPILMRIMPLGKYKGRPIKDLPLDYLMYSARRDFDQDLLFQPTPRDQPPQKRQPLHPIWQSVFRVVTVASR